MERAVREKLDAAVKAAEGEHSAEDLLRCFAEQAQLMLRTDEVVRHLTRDPFQNLGEIKSSVDRLCKLTRVTQYEKTVAKTGYCRIAATVELKADQEMTRVGVAKYVELSFEYERDGTIDPDDNACVWYSIDVSRDDGPKEKLLWVKVFGAGPVPSHLPAQNIDEEDGGWEDVDKEEGVEEEFSMHDEMIENTKCKKARIAHDDEVDKSKNDQFSQETRDHEDGADRYTVGMDPDALERLLRWANLGEMEDVTAFFLLMTFPFAEPEYDLVDFLLEGVFGPDDENNDDEDA